MKAHVRADGDVVTFCGASPSFQTRRLDAGQRVDLTPAGAEALVLRNQTGKVCPACMDELRRRNRAAILAAPRVGR